MKSWGPSIPKVAINTLPHVIADITSHRKEKPASQMRRLFLTQDVRGSRLSAVGEHHSIQTNLKQIFRIYIIPAVAIVALGVSIYAVYTDNSHFRQSMDFAAKQYEEVTKPHSRHQEIYDKLSRLDMRIETAKATVTSWASQGVSTTDFMSFLRSAEELRNQADKAWLTEDYDKADEIIQRAFDYLDRIPPAPPPTPTTVMNWWLIGGVIAGVAVMAVLVSLVIRRRAI